MVCREAGLGAMVDPGRLRWRRWSCEGGSGWVGPGGCNGKALGDVEGTDGVGAMGGGRKGRKVALDDAKLRVGLEDRLKADGRRAKRSRATPREVVEAAQKLEGGDVVCRLSLVESERRGLRVRAGEGRSRFMASQDSREMQQQKVISGLQRW